MIPDKTYRIEPVTVFRLVDEDGKEVVTEGEYGDDILHFDSYAEAAEEVRRRRELPRQGPLTQAEQGTADASAAFHRTMSGYYEKTFREQLGILTHLQK